MSKKKFHAANLLLLAAPQAAPARIPEANTMPLQRAICNKVRGEGVPAEFVRTALFCRRRTVAALAIPGDTEKKFGKDWISPRAFLLKTVKRARRVGPPAGGLEPSLVNPN